MQERRRKKYIMNKHVKNNKIMKVVFSMRYTNYMEDFPKKRKRMAIWGVLRRMVSLVAWTRLVTRWDLGRSRRYFPPQQLQPPPPPKVMLPKRWTLPSKEAWNLPRFRSASSKFESTHSLTPQTLPWARLLFFFFFCCSFFFFLIFGCIIYIYAIYVYSYRNIYYYLYHTYIVFF